MSYPKIKPCPLCGSSEDMDVYTYDNGCRHVECTTTCGYLGPASSSILWAIRHHNSQRDKTAARHAAALATSPSPSARKDRA
ncbi:hypothetical protein SAMN04487974_102164 [Pelagibacterium luteolum]|uniref:Restriction alleviation protein, Lar family n=1 Tax=Pelagibacterium luteolum TaxID=440168 RepID=A0A1G7TJV6_9HYPH|nr:hypothetical protein SAMN04487974_102164 [Pelagibacterium luteolum]